MGMRFSRLLDDLVLVFSRCRLWPSRSYRFNVVIRHWYRAVYSALRGLVFGDKLKLSILTSIVYALSDLSEDEALLVKQKVHSEYSHVTEPKTSKVASRMDGRMGIFRTGKIFLGRVDSLMGLLLLLIGMVGGVLTEIDLSDLRRLLKVYAVGFLGKLLMNSWLTLRIGVVDRPAIL